MVLGIIETVVIVALCIIALTLFGKKTLLKLVNDGKEVKDAIFKEKDKEHKEEE